MSLFCLVSQLVQSRNALLGCLLKGGFHCISTILCILYFQIKPPGRPGTSADAENAKNKQASEHRKKISQLKNVDSKLANHILDEIIERYKVVLSNFIFWCLACLSVFVSCFFENNNIDYKY